MVLSLLLACASLPPQGVAPAALPTPAAPDRPIGQRPLDAATRLLAPLPSPPPGSRFAALDGLVALDRDTTIAVIDGTTAWRWDGAGPPAVLANAPEQLARTADGSHLLWCRGGVIEYIDPFTGQVARALPAAPGGCEGAPAVAAGGAVASWTDEGIAVWSRQGAPRLLLVPSVGGTEPTGAHLALDAPGQRLGTGGSGVVELWDVAEGVRLWATPSGTADERVAVLADGAVLAAGAVEGGAGRVVRFTHDGRIAWAWDGEVLRAGAVAAFSPDGRTIALVDRDQLRLLDSATGIEVGAVGLPDRPTEYPTALAWSADGETLVAAWTDWAIGWWDVAWLR